MSAPKVVVLAARRGEWFQEQLQEYAGQPELLERAVLVLPAVNTVVHAGGEDDAIGALTRAIHAIINEDYE